MIDSEKEYYWADATVIKYDFSLLSSLDLDDETISIKGLPEWVAPNICFGHYEAVENLLKIGEDRDDQDIYLDIKSGKVLFGTSRRFVNTSAKALRETLKAYAEMVEQAISIGENAVIENRIPDDFILEFKLRLLDIDVYAVDHETFWMNEIERCLGHRSD